MAVIDLTVCQGIGDIFWVYQQFIRHVDGIRFHVANPGQGAKVHSRSHEFLRGLPGVVSADTVECTDAEYQHLAHARFDAEAVLRAGGGWFAVNDALEHEIRLEDICPALPIMETVPLKTTPVRLPPKFVALYVSENAALDWMARDYGVWMTTQWREFVQVVYDRFQLVLPLVMVGAEYDRRAMYDVTSGLRGVELREVIGRSIFDASYVLSKAEMLLGYQSGLGIIADQFDTPQVHIYMETVWGIRNSWPKRRNLGTVYQPFCFRQSPAEVAAAMIWPTPTTAGTSMAAGSANVT